MLLFFNSLSLNNTNLKMVTSNNKTVKKRNIKHNYTNDLFYFLFPVVLKFPWAFLFPSFHIHSFCLRSLFFFLFLFSFFFFYIILHIFVFSFHLEITFACINACFCFSFLSFFLILKCTLNNFDIHFFYILFIYLSSYGLSKLFSLLIKSISFMA